MLLFFLISLSLLASGCSSLDRSVYTSDTAELIEYRTVIQPELLKRQLEIIAHDSLGGRGSATPGIRKAADFLAGYYRELGFTPVGGDDSYFQPFDLTTAKMDSLVYTLYRSDMSEKELFSRSVEKPLSASDFTSIITGYHPSEGDIVFAGFGLDDKQAGIEQLKTDLTENGWVLMFEEIPDSLQHLWSLSAEQMDINTRIDRSLNRYGASGVLLITDLSGELYRESVGNNIHFNRSHGRMELAYLQDEPGRLFPGHNVKYVEPAIAAALLGVDPDSGISGLKAEISENLNRFTPVKTPYVLNYQPYYPGTVQDYNVAALFEGADPELNHEAVVLMAHYDHLGIRSGVDGEMVIYNGADDNGSGTVALMAIAEALHEARLNGLKPKRSILFLHVSAEEIGLLGSRYYSDHPIIPIENTIASFNADMIGRTDRENSDREDFNSIYLIGGEIISSGLDSLVVHANERSVEMRLDRKFNDLTDRNQFYRRSDHWNFGRLGVPFVFFFTGVHEDYHRPTDTPDKINYDKYHRVVQLIYSSTIEAANTAVRPVMDNEMFINITQSSGRR